MPSPKGDTRSPAETAEVVPARAPYVSASMEVLETLEIENSLASLDARLDSLEIDIARLGGTRDDDARRIAGEMAVMKARVEDALNAFSSTADELRDMSKSVAKRLDDVTAGALPDAVAGGLRAEITAGIDGVMAGVGDVLESLTSDLSTRMETLAAQMRVVQEGMGSIADAVGALSPLEERLRALEASIAAPKPAKAKRKPAATASQAQDTEAAADVDAPAAVPSRDITPARAPRKRKR